MGYGYRQLGVQQADRYLDGLFSAIEEIAEDKLARLQKQ